MDRELVRPSQSDHRDASNGSSPQMSSTPTTPTPPRLTPNPMLLDSPAPTQTPTTSSPPPPLTPAPSVSSTHTPKVAAGGTPSPHILIPAPPKLTSTASPALRTYSRPILPSPAGKTSATQSSSPSSLLPPSSSSHAATSSSSSLLSSSSASGRHSNTTKTSTSLTNGNTRPVTTPSSTPITPFHTPASPPGRQVSQAHPVGSPGHMRANQSSSPVRQRVSQQTLLLGKGLKGSGQDQVLLRAQMLILTSAMRPPPSSSSSSSPSSNPASTQLQSLTLRPPPPGALTIPPSLRLKPPSSAPPPPLSRPHALPIFPPLRPRPQPSTMATDGPATPSRHLSVPPPTLYSPVHVPLRPRLCPKGHRAASPRQTSSFQPIAAAPSAHACPVRPLLSGPKTNPLSQTALGCGPSPLSSPGSRPAASHFERSPSAARQLQIIALSSSRQPQPGTYSHGVSQSPPAELSNQIKRTLSSDEALPLPLNSSLPKTSPPSVLSPPSPPCQTGPQTQTQKGEVEEGEEHRERGVRQAITDEESVSKDNQRETVEEKQTTEKDVGHNEQVETGRGEEQMEVTEEGQGDRDKTEEGQNDKKGTEHEGDIAMDQSDNQNACPVPTADTVKDSNTEPKPILGLVSGPVPAPSPAPVPVPEAQSQRLPETDREPESMSQEDFCENMSTQSDNQSALSSLSSQSPPSSPFITTSAENPPPVLPTQTNLSPSQHETEKVHKSVGESEQLVEAETQPLGQSEDNLDGPDQSPSGPWEPKAWPEGQQVLTHLVEGFVIQEGLQPFPVNRSSLLVPEQVAKPQEVNGTNGSSALPVTDAVPQTEPSTDSDEEDGVDTDEGHTTRSGHRDRTVLHCQFCGKRGHAHNFMRSKRFCSTSCARGFNVRLTKRLRALSAGSRSEKPRPALNRAESVPGKPLLLRLPRDLWSAGRREKEGREKVVVEDEEMAGGGEEDDDDEDGGGEDPAVAMTVRMDRRAARRARRASAPAVTTSTPTSMFRAMPSQWSVEEVTAFIHALPGCSDVAEAFRVQEIDGQALLLLTEDHLMTSMNIKLGPALKICAHINALKNQ